MNRREVLIASGLAMAGAGARLLRAESKIADKEKACALAGTPLEDLHLDLCAFHVAKEFDKDKRKSQVEAHHYCMPLSDDLFQCIVLESNKPKARILGVEYIVTDRIYQKLPDGEKRYWHPHPYEVTSGLLVAPNLSPEEDTKLMEMVKTTWGKTWHTWPNPKESLPLGEPILMWAFDRDGQIDPQLIQKRDEDLKIDTKTIQKRRR
jgi:hypothetical protein